VQCSSRPTQADCRGEFFGNDETIIVLDWIARLALADLLAGLRALRTDGRNLADGQRFQAAPSVKRQKFSKADVVEKVLRCIEAKDTGRALYKESDKLLKELLPHLKVNEPIDLGNGATAKLIDNFEEDNKAWKPCGINRFDLEATRARSLAKPASGPETAQTPANS
jgi:hypothetical protein